MLRTGTWSASRERRTTAERRDVRWVAWSDVGADVRDDPLDLAPDLAEALYDRFCASLTTAGLRVARGRFGTHMQVTSCNDGPVTLEIVVRDGAVV